MTTWIALLRGINVGGNRRVPMAVLRAALEQAGLEDVRTYIVSGNVLFRSERMDDAALTGDIERAIEARFGFAVAVVLRTAAEMQAILASDPLPEGSAADPAHRYAVFLSADPAPERLAAIDAAAVAPDEFVAGDRVIHAWYRNGLQESRLAGQLTDKGLGVTATAATGTRSASSSSSRATSIEPGRGRAAWTRGGGVGTPGKPGPERSPTRRLAGGPGDPC